MRSAELSTRLAAIKMRLDILTAQSPEGTHQHDQLADITEDLRLILLSLAPPPPTRTGATLAAARRTPSGHWTVETAIPQVVPLPQGADAFTVASALRTDFLRRHDTIAISAVVIDGNSVSVEGTVFAP